MLYHMLKAQKEPKNTLAPSVPKMLTLNIPQSAIGKVSIEPMLLLCHAM